MRLPISLCLAGAAIHLRSDLPRQGKSLRMGGGGVCFAVAAIGGGGPPWELDDAAWELFARLGGGPLDGILFKGGSALLVKSWRAEALLDFAGARAPSDRRRAV